MEIFKFAMDLELDGKKYYEELMEETKNKGLKNIFKMLAKDEEEHYRIVKDLRKEFSDALKSETLKESNNIFANMLKSKDFYTEDKSHIEAYKHACGLEDKSIELYNEQLQNAKDENEKKIFEMLVQEEKKHKIILENIIEFVSEPSQNRAVKTKNSDPEFARWDKTNM